MKKINTSQLTILIFYGMFLFIIIFNHWENYKNVREILTQCRNSLDLECGMGFRYELGGLNIFWSLLQDIMLITCPVIISYNVLKIKDIDNKIYRSVIIPVAIFLIMILSLNFKENHQLIGVKYEELIITYIWSLFFLTIVPATFKLSSDKEKENKKRKENKDEKDQK